jgi:hypothetical protein
MEVSPKSITVQYYGTRHIVLAEAVFKSCLNEVLTGDIVLAEIIPDADAWHDRTFVEYSGVIDLKDIHRVLVARNFELTKAGKLRAFSVSLRIGSHTRSTFSLSSIGIRILINYLAYDVVCNSICTTNLGGCYSAAVLACMIR